jgi:putative membrane protein
MVQPPAFAIGAIRQSLFAQSIHDRKRHGVERLFGGCHSGTGTTESGIEDMLLKFRKLILSVIVAGWPHASAGHVVAPMNHRESFNPWLVDPFAVILLLLIGWIYWRGGKRRERGESGSHDVFRRRQRYFWLGWLALAAVLASPLDPMGEVLFSAHMIQHEIIMLIAAPLLVLSRPSSMLLRGMSLFLARGIGTLTRGGSRFKVWQWLVSPPVAWSIHTVGLWGWHLPDLFNASLQNTAVHALQHVSFLWIALLFWFAFLRPYQPSSSAGVLYFFTTAIHASLLGALMTFSPEVWYAPYLTTAPQWGLSALEDQQLGGLIMWIPTGVVFVAAGLFSLARTMRASDIDVDRQTRHSSHEG